MSETFDHEVDFLVVGSGGGGMTAALAAADVGMDALIVEKGKSFGGSTALSGGHIWIPNNPALRKAGHNDSPESVKRYLAQVTEGDGVSTAKIEAFVDHGPAAMEMLEKSPWMRFFWVKGYADYHPEFAGGRPLGRSVEANAFDTQKLGDLEATLPPNSMKGPMGLWVSAADYHDLAMSKRTWRGRRMTLVAAWRVASNMVRRRHMATTGRSLVARMRMALRDAGVPLWLETPMQELIVEDGRVVGIVAERDGKPYRIKARNAVMLASGGFDHNETMRKEFLPQTVQRDFSGGAQTNTGDGISAGREVDADVEYMDDAWWMPSVIHPSGAVIPLVSERSIPRQVIVSGKTGERFTNEAAPYVNFVHDQIEGDHFPLWFVMDQTARDRYPFARVLPGADFSKKYYDAGTVVKADTIEELAEKIGVPKDKLSATLERFNTYARSGKDPEYGRGDSAYDRYYGDPTLPNPTLDVVDTAPFYGIRVEAGDLGTKGGLKTDEAARVLRADGSVIEGLYATGNASGSVMGHDYPGAGGTIGPAVVFGYVGALHAGRSSRVS